MSEIKNIKRNSTRPHVNMSPYRSSMANRSKSYEKMQKEAERELKKLQEWKALSK